MKKIELDSCGTVMKLDLAFDKDFGNAVVALSGTDIKRIVEILYENLPDKTAADKKCRDFLSTRLLAANIKFDVCIVPVLNKTALRQQKAYQEENRHLH